MKNIERDEFDSLDESIHKPEISVLTKEKLLSLKTLEVEVVANFNFVLQALRKATGADLQPRSNGFHLTVIGPTEYKFLRDLDDDSINELQKINEDIQKGEGVLVKGIGFIDGASSTLNMRDVDKVKKTSFVAVDIPALQSFRQKVGLPPKDFHITIGFEGGDIHSHIIRQEPVKLGSTKIKNITGAIPKQADSRFDDITLPNMRFGALDGQDK